MMKKTESFTVCEIFWSAISFLNATNIKPVHQQIYDIYRENAMSDSMVQKQAQLFNEEHNNVNVDDDDDDRAGGKFLLLMIYQQD